MHCWLTPLQVADLIFDLVHPVPAIEPAWPGTVHLIREEAGPLLDHVVHIHQPECLLVSEVDYLQIAKIVQLLLPVSYSVLRHSVTSGAILRMNVVAWHHDEFEALIGCLVLRVPPDRDIVAHLVPVKAQQCALTVDVLLEHAG